jgi:succinyl-diaminopimelate desuccinylase
MTMPSSTREEVVALAMALMERASVTPDDAGCQTLVAQRLAKAGYSIRHLPFGDVRNMFAWHGEGAPVLCLAGHTDVVPPGPVERWRTDPFRPTLRDGRLYGRGAADMKGAVAAMVVAMERFIHACPEHRGTLALLLTSDEEGPATEGTIMALRALREEGWAVDYALVGEPSSEERLGDVIKVGRRGSLSAACTIFGKQGHVAYPQKADNPIHRALPALEALAGHDFGDGDTLFAPTSLQLTNITAGVGADNVIPSTLEFRLNCRYPPATSAHHLQQQITAVMECHHLRHDLRWTEGAHPFLGAQGALFHALTAAVRATTGTEPRPSTAGGTSDGRFFHAHGAEVAELGPRNESSHQIDEWVIPEELERLAMIYQETCRRLLAA